MEIGGFDLNSRCLIIAELSANHGGKLEVALETVKAAKQAGADAIKLQTFTPDTITLNCNNAYFQINNGSLWDGRTLYELYEEAHTPWEWHAPLFEAARNEGLLCFSSPFDRTAVDFLEELKVPAYKIASFEIQDIPLIEYTASKGKPIIISTGIATEEDIRLAVDTCRSVGNTEVILLKCTSAYPAPVELSNLNTIPDLKARFDVEAGLSDHTTGILVPTLSVAVGAKVIEKHFILDKAIGGPDVEFSLDPQEFREMVDSVRKAESALGKATYEMDEKVQRNRQFARSLFVVQDVKRGEALTSDNIRSVRPGYGLHPKFFKALLGKKVNQNIERGTPLKLEMIED